MTHQDFDQAPDSSPSAKAFFQEWLDNVAAAFFRDDFGAYAEAVLLPLTVKTDGNALVVVDHDQLRDGFDAWVKMMKANKVTHMIRTPLDAVWVNDTLLSGLYETQILSDANRVMPIFTSLMELHLVDETWRAKTVVNGMKNITWPIVLPMLVPDKDGKA